MPTRGWVTGLLAGGVLLLTGAALAADVDAFLAGTSRNCIDCDLSGRDLSERDLKRVRLDRAKLRDADLAGATLFRAVLVRAPISAVPSSRTPISTSSTPSGPISPAPT